MKQSLKEFVDLLKDLDGFVTFAQATEILGYSSRYLSMLAEEDNLKNGFIIHKVSRKGFRLEIVNEDALKRAMQTKDHSIQIIYDILHYFCLNNEEFVKLDNLANKFHISRSTLNRLMEDVKEISKNYNLSFVSKPHYGTQLRGDEIDKRRCLSEIYTKMNIKTKETLLIQKILYSTLKKHQYEITDISFNNLVIHINILIMRLRTSSLELKPISLKTTYHLQDKIAGELINKLSDAFEITIPIQEKNYLILHLLGKQVIGENKEIPDIVQALVEKIVDKIFETTGLDFSNDVDFKIGLALHVKPLLYRMKYGLSHPNPLLNQVKSQLSEAYELALLAKKVLETNCSGKVSDDEVGYLAVHFSLGLSNMRNKSDEKDLKLVLVCSTGRGTSQLLKYNLQKAYNLTNDQVRLASIFELDDLNIDEFNYILTTIDLPKQYSVPVLKISPNMGVKDLKNFKKEVIFQSPEIVKEIYLDMPLKNKKKVLRHLANESSMYYKEGNTLYRDMLKRERYSSTEVGNYCALPHPFAKYSEKPYIIFISLKEPIIWDQEKIKFVISMGFPLNYKYREEVIEEVTKIIADKQSLLDFYEELNLAEIRELR